MLSITVDTNLAVVDANDGFTSLREAISTANATPGADMIDFAPALTAGGQFRMPLHNLRLVVRAERRGEHFDQQACRRVEHRQQMRLRKSTAAALLAGLAKVDLQFGSIGHRKSGPLGKERAMTVPPGLVATAPRRARRSFEQALQRRQRQSGTRPAVRFRRASQSGLTLTGGKTTRNNKYNGVGANHYLFSGGAIHSFSVGALTLDDVNVVGSGTTGTGAAGGGIASRTKIDLTDSIVDSNQVTGYANGGGIWSYGNVTLTRTTISDNTMTFVPTGFSTQVGGGGVFLLKGQITVTDSLVQGNFAAGAGRGGGIYGGVTITGSSILGNRAAEGGGVWGGGTVTASTISGNSASSQGGGIYGSNVTLTSCTVSGNSVMGQFGRGGGIAGRSATLLMSTIVDNHASGTGANGGGVAMTSATSGRGSIIAGNSAGALGQNVYGSCSLFFSLLGSSQVNATRFLTEAPVGSPDSKGNLVGGPVFGVIDPMLGPLANNGGPTMTRALGSKSCNQCGGFGRGGGGERCAGVRSARDALGAHRRRADRHGGG
jgi:predicted outer membrane repeat protein